MYLCITYLGFPVDSDCKESTQITYLGFPVDSDCKESPANPPAGDLGSIPSRENPLGKEMATHSSILAWEIPWAEDPGGLQSVGLHKSWT